MRPIASRAIQEPSESQPAARISESIVGFRSDVEANNGMDDAITLSLMRLTDVESGVCVSTKS